MARRDTENMIFAEEALIVDAQTAINTLMVELGVSRAELAERLGVSQARVSQMFSDNAKNLTLRTLARVFHALGDHCRITSDQLEPILGSTKSAEIVEREESGAHFGSVFELVEHLERASQDAYSNDNRQADALAA